MSEWEKRPLGDLVEVHNARRVPVAKKDRIAGEFPYYGASGIVDYVREHLFDGLFLLIAEDGENLRSRKTPVAFLANGRFWVNNHAHIVTANELSDTRFLSFAVESSDISGYLTGSAQPKLSKRSMLSIQVTCPPLDEQKRIAATLGALDDKIESNRTQIKTLNQIARSMFQEWRSRTANTSLSTFGKSADVFGGATPKTAIPDYWGGRVLWATPTDVTNLPSPYLYSTGRTITEDGLNSCTAVLHPPGTIFMTSRATIGAFAINQVAAATNQGFVAVRPKVPAHRWFLFEEMRARVDEFIDNANGSTFLEISRGRFKELPLAIPSTSDLELLDSRLNGVHELAANRERENTRLAALRDALLPELLSGRIRTTEIEDTVQEATA